MRPLTLLLSMLLDRSVRTLQVPGWEVGETEGSGDPSGSAIEQEAVEVLGAPISPSPASSSSTQA